MSKSFKNILYNKSFWSATILLLFIAASIFYIVTNWTEFSNLKLESPEFLLLLAFMALVNLYGTGRSMDAVLQPLGLNLSSAETFGLASITRLGNQIAPGKMGIAIRATYLKRQYNLPLAKFVSTLAAAQILTQIISSVFGIVAIVVLWQSAYIPELIPFALLLVGILVGLSSMLLFSPKLTERKNKILNYFIKANNGWHTIRRDRNALLRASFWVTVNILSQALIIFAAFSSFGASISLVQSLFVTSINNFSAIIAITPAGFGISEGLIIGSATAVGLPVSLALSAAILRRIVVFVVVVISTIFSSHKLVGVSMSQLFKHSYKKDGS